jgi:hypothetical protein
MSIGRHDKKFFSILLATSFVLAASLLPAAFDGAGPQAFAQDKGSKDKLTAKEIVDRMVDKNNAMGVESGQADIRLTIKGRGADDARVRELRIRAKKIDDRAHTILKLTAPKEVAGQAFLFVESPKEGGDNDIWTYTPAFNHTQRMKGSERNKEFLGTHFTFADLENRDFKDAKLERLPDEKRGGSDVYVISATPTAKSSTYGKMIAYIRKSDSIPMTIKFYQKDGKTLAKTIFSEKLDKDSEGNTYVKQMTVRAETGGYTTMLITSIDTKVELPDAIFSSERLGD